MQTEPRGLAAIGRRKATTPITKPIQIRPDERTDAERRVGELLTTIVSGRKTWLDLWTLLHRYWPLAGAATTARRQALFQEAITAAGSQDVAWRAATPRHCGPSERTALDHCTARDTCGVHRSHNYLWADFEHRAARHLLHEIPEIASTTVEKQPPPKRRGR